MLVCTYVSTNAYLLHCIDELWISPISYSQLHIEFYINVSAYAPNICRYALEDTQ